MSLDLNLVLALLVAVPCVIALAKATDAKNRIVPALTLLAVAVALGAPAIQRQFGTIRHLSEISWVTTGVLAIITGVRLAQPWQSTLVITGGTLGALLALGIVSH